MTPTVRVHPSVSRIIILLNHVEITNSYYSVTSLAPATAIPILYPRYNGAQQPTRNLSRRTLTIAAQLDSIKLVLRDGRSRLNDF